MNNNLNLSENIQDSIIFYMLTDLKFLQICRNKIDFKIFQSPIQQKICQIIFLFYDEYKTIIDKNIDEIILPKFHENEQNIITQYLLKLFSSTYVKDYVQDQLDLFCQKREWEQALIECVEHLDKNDLNAIENKVYKIIRNKFNYSDIKNVFDEDLKDFYHIEYEGELCCPTGIKDLDAIIGGLKRKQLTVIVAPLNVGKSFCFVFLGSKALLYGKTVIYITTEMSRHQVKERFFMRFAGVTDKDKGEIDIWSGKERIKFKPDSLKNINKVKKSLKAMKSFGGKLFIVEYPDKTLTISKMESLLNDIEIEQGKYPDLVLVDGLQGLKYNEKGKDQDWKALEELSHELRRIAMEKNIAVVTSTHSQRGALAGKLVQAKDIRGSIDILNVADLGISINQTNEEYSLGQARLFIMRSRSSKKWAQIRIYQNYDMGHFAVYSELME